MKKIVALMMLCMLLCAVSATAFAANVNIFENLYNDAKSVSKTVEGSTYELPTYESVFGSVPTGEQFLGWKLPNSFFYSAGQTVQVTDGMEIKAYLISANEYDYKAVYLPGRGKGEQRFMPATGGSIELLGIDSFFDFEPPVKDGKKEKFVGWMVKGVFGYPPEPGKDVGWLFARAIAESSKEEIIYREELVKADVASSTTLLVGGTLEITAMWEEDDGQGGGQGGGGNGGEDGQGGGGNGGNNGGGAGNGAAASMPSTGDNSLRIDFLFVAMLASLVGLRLMAKKRIN